jgi:hypothetical protein
VGVKHPSGIRGIHYVAVDWNLAHPYLVARSEETSKGFEVLWVEEVETYTGHTVYND